VSNKFEALLGDWRSFAVKPVDPKKPEELTTPDGVFHIDEITDRGKIKKAEHELNPKTKREVYGQAIAVGPSLTIVMEHLAFTSNKKVSRYIGTLVVDVPGESVIIGRKGSYDLDKVKGTDDSSEAAAGSDVDAVDAALVGQDDGTVIITKP
jgi:hypothetical protein